MEELRGQQQTIVEKKPKKVAAAKQRVDNKVEKEIKKDESSRKIKLNKDEGCECVHQWQQTWSFFISSISNRFKK